jgi:hypothetical protein
MMQIVTCDNCHVGNIALDAISVSVVLTKHKFCDKCYNSHDEKVHYHFCSLPCFMTYAARVANQGDVSFTMDKYKDSVVEFEH